MENLSDAIEEVKKRLPGLECRRGEPMKNHTSFKVGGEVAAMFLPKSLSEATTLLRLLRGMGIRPLIFGNGTNLLVEDGHLDIVAVKTYGGLAAVSLTGDGEITAECGALLSKIAAFAAERGLSGLEFAHGIPGTLGGAVLMNAGAYGGEMKDVISSVTFLSPELEERRAEGPELDFSYRKSRFSDSDGFILSAVLRLKPGDPAEIKSRMEELSRRRRESQPLNLPSAGSAFKRPKNGYAAALIEQAGLKGYSVGGARVSEKHAGFVVNTGGASFSDVMSVLEHVQKVVYACFGVRLEPEVRIVRAGEYGRLG